MVKKKGFLWVDLAGTQLTDEDRLVLTHPKVSGVILFAKNFTSKVQLKSLTREIMHAAPGIFIVTDHEGGRVQRFREGFTELPAMRYWGDEYIKSSQKTNVSMVNTLQKMVSELHEVGVYATLAPVLDIDHNRSQIIGARSFSSQSTIVSALGRVFIDCLQNFKMPVMAKHFPGHGYVVADSHLDLPIDERDAIDIFENDLMPFAAVAHCCDAIMPAHVIYQQLDDKPACFSSFWLKKILRQRLRFDGLIVSDDLTMQGAASMGSYVDRAYAALEAGCDILSVCNNRAGAIEIIDAVNRQKCENFDRRLAHYGRFLP